MVYPGFYCSGLHSLAFHVFCNSAHVDTSSVWGLEIICYCYSIHNRFKGMLRLVSAMDGLCPTGSKISIVFAVTYGSLGAPQLGTHRFTVSAQCGLNTLSNINRYQ